MENKTKLFIVGTPIGNFEDITLRAIRILKEVDVIACEDTRVTQKLLHHFDIRNKKLIAYHNFNERNSARGIIELINNQNKSIALVSDAGMPTISDPGFNLIEEAYKNNIEFEIIPGVSAITTIMTASNLGPDFTFLGFGKPKKGQLTNQIKSLNPGTYIFFVSPHKIESFLEIINETCNEHILFVGREMTKLHQSFYRGNANEIRNQIKDKIKGEFSVVLKKIN